MRVYYFLVEKNLIMREKLLLLVLVFTALTFQCDAGWVPGFGYFGSGYLGDPNNNLLESCTKHCPGNQILDRDSCTCGCIDGYQKCGYKCIPDDYVQFYWC